MSAYWERHQVALYLGGLLVGAVIGLWVPGTSSPAAASINLALAVLLYVTFLGIPFGRMREALRDWRFLLTVLAVNFVAVPAVAYGLSRCVAYDRVLVVGVLFVLLAPCVDYVIVFSGLAGGAAERLVVAAPLLMVVQLVALPLYLWWFTGSGVVDSIDLTPFGMAFLVIIAIPLAAACATQWAATRSALVAKFQSGALTAMVPIMVVTLALVVASQIAGVRAELSSLLPTVPLYLAFAAVMTLVGMAAGRLAGLDVPARRSVVFSGVTRNSLVILPPVLALPAIYDLAPLVVVTQTLVELVVMVILVRVLPKLITTR